MARSEPMALSARKAIALTLPWFDATQCADRAMKMFKHLATTVIASLWLASCATTQGLSAAPDVHALLVSIRDNDRAAFDAHIDRLAMEAQIQAILVERAKAFDVPDSVKGLGLLVSGPLAKVAAKALIRPDVFRAVADYYGYRPQTPVPGTFAIAAALRPVAGGRVCAARGRQGPCLLTFADEGGTWRLVAFNGDAAMLRLGGHAS
jgi:hypothetical protein